MAKQRTQRALIGFILFSVVCVVLAIIAWQSPARHLWMIRREYEYLASFPYQELNKQTVVECLAAQNDPRALPLARTMKEPFFKPVALVAVAKATRNMDLLKEALEVIRNDSTGTVLRNPTVVAFNLSRIAREVKDAALLREVLDATRILADLDDKAMVSSTVARVTQDPELYREALNNVKAQTNRDKRARYLVRIAVDKKEAKLLQEALYIARTTTNLNERFYIIFRAGKATQDTKLLKEALASARAIKDPLKKVGALIAFAVGVKDALLLKEAISILSSVSDESNRAWLFDLVAVSGLSQQLFRDDLIYRKELTA